METLLVLIILGGFPLLRGIWMLKGGSKAWFFSRNIFAGFSYAQIPMGVGFLLLAITVIPQFQKFQLLFNIGIGFMILGVVFNFLQPSFLKPAWLKWLEHEHKDVMAFLVADAHEMGLDVWEKRVETQAGLEEWVVEVRRKHGQNH